MTETTKCFICGGDGTIDLGSHTTPCPNCQTAKKVPCSDAFDGACPDCGHVFTLMDLARMARGDGFQRHIAVRLPDGSRAVVSFDDLDPIRMQYWAPSVEPKP